MRIYDFLNAIEVPREIKSGALFAEKISCKHKSRNFSELIKLKLK